MLKVRFGSSIQNLHSFLYVGHALHTYLWGKGGYLNKVIIYETMFYYVPQVGYWGSEDL